MNKSDTFEILSLVFFMIPILWAVGTILNITFLIKNDIVLQARIMLFFLFLGIAFYIAYNKSVLSKKNFIGNIIQAIFVILIGLLIIFESLDLGPKFFIVSFLFFAVAAATEQFAIWRIRVNKNYSKKSKNLGVLSGLLWVHGIVRFIAKENTSIYDAEKVGYVPLSSAYFTIFLYVFVAYILYQYSVYGLLIYLIPVATNVIYALRYDYLAMPKR